MEKAIIISDSLKATEFYQDFLQKNGCHTIKVVDNGEEAKRSFVSYDYDVCIINTPLHSDMCEQLSIDLAEQNTAQVILFVKSDCMDEMTERVENYGILTVEKPINKQMFWSALKFSQVISRRIELCNEKIKKLQRQLEELKSQVPVNRILDDIIKDKPKELGQLIAYDKAIEIVKAGGNIELSEHSKSQGNRTGK